MMPQDDHWLHDDAPRTFGQALGAYLNFRRAEKSPKTRLKHDWLAGVLRPLWNIPLDDVQPQALMRLLRQREGKAQRETAHRAARFAVAIFQFATGEGWTKNSLMLTWKPTLEPLRAVSHPAITDELQFGKLMLLVDQRGYSQDTVYNALRLLPRVALRPGELRNARWSDVNRDKAELIIPIERMKMRRSHLVPLSRQALEILEEQWAVSGHQEYIFPGVRPRRPMSDAAMNMALRGMFITSDAHVPHGFRVAFSTILNERDPSNGPLVELQLSHRKGDKVASIYDRSERVPDRHKLMQTWGDIIEELKAKARVK